jgi:hypothetical protein
LRAGRRQDADYHRALARLSGNSEHTALRPFEPSLISKMAYCGNSQFDRRSPDRSEREAERDRLGIYSEAGGLLPTRRSTSSLLKKPSSGPAVDNSIIFHELSGARMRGGFADQGGLFSYISPEARVPQDHPLRKIRELVRDVQSEMNRDSGKLYASEGRPPTPPEQMLSALLRRCFTAFGRNAS